VASDVTSTPFTFCKLFKDSFHTLIKLFTIEVVYCRTRMNIKNRQTDSADQTVTANLINDKVIGLYVSHYIMKMLCQI